MYIYKEIGLVNGFKKYNKNLNLMKFYVRELLCFYEIVNIFSVVKLLYGIYYFWFCVVCVCFNI